MSSAAPEPAAVPGGGVRRGLALLVAGAFFMEILDGTVITPAAPHIAASLGVPALSINVAVTAYVLTLAVVIPVSGWCAGRFGARRVFTAALAVFTLGSLASAAAGSLSLLTAARVVQGTGGALMVPVGRLVVLRTTAKEDLIRAVAYLTWPALLAPVLAPAVGGALSTYASWRWIFLLNLPLGVAGLVLTRWLFPTVPGEPTGRLDRRGAGLVALGVAALVLGLESAGAARPDLLRTVLGLGGGAAMLAGATVHLLRADAPLLDLRTLRIRTFRVTAAGGSVFRAVITAVPFLLPLFFELGFGWSAARAGLVVAALFVGNIAVKPATTPLLRRFGIRPVMLVAIAGSAACLAGIALLRPTTWLPLLLALLVASGATRSTGFTSYNTVAFADVPAGAMPSANALLSTVQELGAGLGVAVATLLVHLGGPVARAAGAGQGGGAYRAAFLGLALLLAVPAVEALRLPRSAGAAVTGPRPTPTR